MTIANMAQVRRELRLAVAEIEAACWALEKVVALPPGVVADPMAQLRVAIAAAEAHLERAKQ